MSNLQARRNAKKFGNFLLRSILSDRDEKGRVRFGPDKLRLSQDEGLSDAAKFLKDGISGGHIIQPGGTGKLHEIVVLAEACHKTGGRTLVVVPTIDAVDITVDRFRTLAPHIGVGAVYHEGKDYGQPVTVMTYASLLLSLAKEKINPKDYGLFIADEGHHFLTDLSDETLDKFDRAVKIAFSATPRYYAGKELAASRHFGQLFYNLTYKEAIARKECTPTKSRLIDTNIPLEEYERLFAQATPPSEDGGAYERAINQVPWNQTFVDLYGTYTDEETGRRVVGDKALVFCAGIQHAKDMARQFNDTLMPYINGLSKYTELGWDIREALEAKGINPDHVKYACAPVWGSMDKEGGWASELTDPSYTKKELMQGFLDGEVLSLSCDKLLAESIDIPAITTILNATPTGSFVRAGQRGMRAGRIFKGNRALKIPSKPWAYVFDALPLNWQTSMAAPVLFSEFVLKDLYAMHGAEPPLKNGTAKEPVREQNPGYRVLWDIQLLLSIGAMMEVKRSIAKAEVVPEEFMNDSLAVRELLRQHDKLPPESRRFIGGVYKDWEEAYEASGRPVTGVLSRYKYSIPAEHFRFANSRLYIHRDSIPVIWAERQEFISRNAMVKLLQENGTPVSRYEVDDCYNLIRAFWAGEYHQEELIKPTKYVTKEYADSHNARIKLDYEKKMNWLPHVDRAAIREYSEKDFLSVDLMPIFKEQISVEPRRIEYFQKWQARQEALKGWRTVVGLIDELADKGFVGLGRNELFSHAAAAALAAEKGEQYGGEDFYPGEFQFSSRRGNDEPTSLPSREIAQVHIRGYRLESFIDALAHFNPLPNAEPSKFPAKISECFPVLRKASGGELSWKEFGGILNRMLDRDRRDGHTNRHKRLKIAFDLSSDDVVVPKSPDGEIKLTRHGYESFKKLYAIRPPDGFIHGKDVMGYVQKIIGTQIGFAVYETWRVTHILQSAFAKDMRGVGSVEIAGVSIPLSGLWRRDPYVKIAHETVIEDKGLYYSKSIVPKMVALHTATLKACQEFDTAFRAAHKSSAANVTVRGKVVPLASSYTSSHKLKFRIDDVKDEVFFSIVETILKQTHEQTSEVSSAFRDDQQSRRAPRRALAAAVL